MAQYVFDCMPKPDVPPGQDNKISEVTLKRQPWEYAARKVHVNSDFPGHPGDVIQMLSDMGDDDWELVQAFEHSYRRHRMFVYIFKRPKDES
jgi:hypothetical protein